ncbi:site-specific integrase [uncultured Zhongshania sp.]|uniref:tyrosine-type recombinase/integrase n=1 Tax=uncultured Zhongshania sp. TaxID=1642288 RepID=UPI0025D8FA76|nr:site-specific integrase [uncultured Zhongshania sp.]
MATFTKRAGNKVQVKVRRKGYEPQSRTFPSLTQAKQWARLVESEMDRGIFLSTSAAESTTIAEALARYGSEVAPSKKSFESIVCRIKRLDRHLGHLTLAAVTPGTVKEYRDFRAETVSGDTIRKEVQLLSQVFKLAQREWDIYLPHGNPVDSISLPRKSKARERRLEQGEEMALLGAAEEYGGYIARIIRLAIETGMRRGEIVNLRWQDINLSSKVAILRDTKNGDDRMIPLSTKAIEVLSIEPRHITGRVFPIRGDSITQAFERVCQRAGIVGLRFHDLRHEATSRLFELGLGIMEVSAITGHKDLAMLKRYTHLKAEDLAIKLR